MTGRLLFPALRWSEEQGFDGERDSIEAALRIGAGGFCIFGGDAAAVRELTRSLRERSDHPLLIASDLERGAGQQFPQATQLPPLAALGSLEDLRTTRRAAGLTAYEALALGVNWLFAPVADIDVEPRNPIVGTRSFGTDARRTAEHVVAWIEGARSAGALCCVKHFPGHGRTVDDSHATLPRVTATRDELELDLLPFRAAVGAGVDAVMTAHVVFDALDRSRAATLSHPILSGLLRGELGFDGLIVSDALVMTGLLEGTGGDEAAAAVCALHAGCDALLYPADAPALAAALDAAVGQTIDRNRVAESLARVAYAAERSARDAPADCGRPGDRAWADNVALQTCVALRGTPAAAPSLELLTIDDDTGGMHTAPDRAPFAAALAECGITTRPVAALDGAAAALVAVYADIRAWKGAPGLSARAGRQLAAALERAPDSTVVFFGHPRLAADLPGRNVLAAWGGEAVMQRAAARWLARAG